MLKRTLLRIRCRISVKACNRSPLPGYQAT